MTDPFHEQTDAIADMVVAAMVWSQDVDRTLADVNHGVQMFKSLALELGLTSGDVAEFATLAADRLRVPRSDSDLLRDREIAINALQKRYGANGWRDALERTQRYVQRDPRLVGWLKSTGLELHSGVVLRLSELASPGYSPSRISHTLP